MSSTSLPEKLLLPTTSALSGENTKIQSFLDSQIFPTICSITVPLLSPPNKIETSTSSALLNRS